MIRLNNDCSQFSDDPRLADVKDHSFVYPLPSYCDLNSWEKRKKDLKQRILVSGGIFGEHPKCKPEVVKTGIVKYEDFYIENIYFESRPGLIVTGNLYLPANIRHKVPAVLNPHGHWDEGRLESSPIADVPARCANLAGMGYIAFSYDMIGYVDNQQLEHKPLDYTYELWGLNLFGLQLWNSMRALDFICSHPMVDTDQIGCTGASGGATQTFFLAAVDDRVKVSVPVNMVSNLYQGGCYCENTAYLRIDANNVEFAALMAPRPMLLVGCSADWTRNLQNDVYPALRNIYSLYGATDNIDMYFEDTFHNYNQNAREQAYRWFSRHISGKDVKYKEKNYYIDKNSLRVFADGKVPNEFPSGEILLKSLKKHNVSLEMAREALLMMTGIEQNSPIKIESKALWDENGIKYAINLAGTEKHGERIPLMIAAKAAEKKDRALIVLDDRGKAAIMKENNFVLKHLGKYDGIIMPDLFLTGEYHTPFAGGGRNYSKSTGEREFYWQSHFTTYNHTDTALRIQDIITISRALPAMGFSTADITAYGDAGLWLLAAAPYLENVEKIKMYCKLPENEDEYISRFFLPGFLAIGGFAICKRLAESSNIMIEDCSKAISIRYDGPIS